MKRTKLIQSVFSVLALCFFFVFSQTAVQADTGTTLTLQLTDYDAVRETLGQDVTGHELTLWRLDASYSYDNREQIVKTLHDWKQDQLKQSFTSSSHAMTFLSDRIEVAEIPDGLYYVRSILDTDKIRYRSEFLLEVDHTRATSILIQAKRLDDNAKLRLIKTDDAGQRLAGVGFQLKAVAGDGQLSPLPFTDGYRYNKAGQQDKILYTDQNGEISVSGLPFGSYRFVEVEALEGYDGNNITADVTLVDEEEVQVTVVNKKLPIGSVQFVKIDGKTRQPLAHAFFKLTRLENGKYVPVLRDGKEVVMESGENGQFSIDKIDYGTYYLWEIQAPTGYSQLSEPISFTVNKESTSSTALVIENTKVSKILVPNTGDALLYLLVLLVLVLFGLGYYMAHKKA